MKRHHRMFPQTLLLVAWFAGFAPFVCAADLPFIAAFESAVREEMREWGITGLDIAMVDDQQTIYAKRFGEARSNHVFRCGSISKLFAATAVAQLVEQGKLDLDAPLEKYAPEAAPVNPWPTNGPIVLRQLLCHRSGMVREAPIGGYFDGSEPKLETVVSSIHATVLPTPPGGKMRYSNVGPSLAGYVVTKVAGVSFPEYQRTHILGPLGMDHSSWQLKDLRGQKVIPSGMRIAETSGGFKSSRAPVFDFGILPAANLFTTAEDLARFISMLAADGRARDGSIVLKPATLAEMFTPQFTPENSGFGLGFSVGSFQGHKTVGHSGAVYGFSSSLVFLPVEKLGVVVLGNQDIVNGRIQKIANLALSLLLEHKLRETPPPAPAPLTLPAEELARFTGEFESQSYWARLSITEGRLVGDISSQPTRFRPVEALRFLADSALYDGAATVFQRDPSGVITGFTLGGQTYTRVPERRPGIPPAWRKLLGGYGPNFIPLIISERHGHLYAMTENMVDYRLTPVNQYVFEMPPGMYVNEQVVFFRGNNGTPTALSLAGMVLKRR